MGQLPERGLREEWVPRGPAAESRSLAAACSCPLGPPSTPLPHPTSCACLLLPAVEIRGGARTVKVSSSWWASRRGPAAGPQASGAVVIGARLIGPSFSLVALQKQTTVQPVVDGLITFEEQLAL